MRKRRKVKTRVFEIPTAKPARRISTGSLGLRGRGVKLAAVPNVLYALDKCTAKEPHVEFIHRLLFNSAGQAMKRKANIRSFSGFVFKDEKERSRCREKILRAHTHVVKKVAYVLDIDPRDTKEDNADAIMAFLDEPRVVEGRANRAEKEKWEKAERKRIEKEKAARKKKELLRKKKEAEAKRVDSDQDGDEDLEFEAKPWVQIVRERQERIRASQENSKNDRIGCQEQERSNEDS